METANAVLLSGPHTVETYLKLLVTHGTSSNLAPFDVPNLHPVSVTLIGPINPLKIVLSTYLAFAPTLSVFLGMRLPRLIRNGLILFL